MILWNGEAYRISEIDNTAGLASNECGQKLSVTHNCLICNLGRSVPIREEENCRPNIIMTTYKISPNTSIGGWRDEVCPNSGTILEENEKGLTWWS
jgi:hypothetical protein